MAYNPHYIVAPGATILEFIKERGMTQAELALRMGRSRKFINEVVKGAAPITSETSLQLEQVLGVPAKFWNSRESIYRERLARMEQDERIQSETRLAQNFPYHEMVKFGWIPKAANLQEKAKNLMAYFGVASLENVVEQRALAAMYRTANRAAFSTYAISAWLRKGVIDAQEKETAGFNTKALTACLEDLRGLTKKPDFKKDLTARLESCGIVLVLTPNLSNAGVHGATRWIKPDRALVQLSLLYRTSDIFWFSFFHEIGHVVLHGKKEMNIDFRDRPVADRKSEEEADRFSADVLVPPNEYKEFLARKDFSRESIIAFAGRIGVGPDIVVGRLQHDGLLPLNSSLNVLKRMLYLKVERSSR